MLTPDYIRSALALAFPYNDGMVANRTVIPAGRLSNHGKRVALVFVVIGLFTFFVPLVTMDPPIMTKSHWSPYQIALQPRQKITPSFSLNVWQMDLGVIYALMLLALVGICLLSSRKVIAGTGILGLVAVIHLWRFAELDLNLKFYGSAPDNELPPLQFGKGVDLTLLIVVLAFVMLACTIIAWGDTSS